MEELGDIFRRAEGAPVAKSGVVPKVKTLALMDTATRWAPYALHFDVTSKFKNVLEIKRWKQYMLHIQV